MDWVITASTRLLYRRERDPVPAVQEAGCPPGRVWTGAENPSLGFDRPARKSCYTDCAMADHLFRAERWIVFSTYVNLSFNELIINFILIIKNSVCSIHSVSVTDLLLRKGEGEKVRAVELPALCVSWNLELIINFILLIKYSVCNIHSVSVRDLLLKKEEGEKMSVVELSALCASWNLVFVIGCDKI